MKQQFNMDEAIELIKQGARIDGKDGVLAPLIKQLIKTTLYKYPKCKQKCSTPIWNWSLTLSQLLIFFEGRLDEALNI